MTIWSKLKHFHPNENWGDKDKVNGLLLLLLDEITDKVKDYAINNLEENAYCIIHCADEQGGHSPRSQHYKGNAADFHFKNISPGKVYIIIQKVLKDLQLENFVGLGVYPDWHNPGFHLDVRGEKARWSRVNGKYTVIKEGVKLL